jgi:carboxyl-terminal processing protease
VPNVIVLVDSSSASAAEAFAGCLKVRRNATILGTRSFGKGIMQSPHMLGIFSGYFFMLTTAEFFAGGRMMVHKVGVQPDGPVPAWLQRNFEPVPFGREMDVAAFRQQHPRPIQELIRSMNLTADEAFCLWGDDGVLCTYERPNPLAGK